MDVLKITPRGYCHGVVDAIKIARQVGAESRAEPVPGAGDGAGTVTGREGV